MKQRTLSLAINKAKETFPAVVVTGPRQSGKTTLLTQLFSATHTYVNLENPDVRLRARQDPLGFLQQYPPPVMLDEIQYVPDLLSYIKTAIDTKRQPGQWLITGSQNFPLMEGISQSLAGRAAVFSLLPFAVAERYDLGLQSLPTPALFRDQPTVNKYKEVRTDIIELLLRGSYPEIATNSQVDRQFWCGSYITTYVERDIRNLKQVGDLSQFERFLRACAIRTGQILNISEMARELGLTAPTIKRWLSLLETGYQVYLLYPYYKNLGKRLRKNPKIYFGDTGLATYLLGLHTPEAIINSPYFPLLFETLVVTDFYKRFLHHGQLPAMYYLRTLDGLEVDLVIEIENKLHLLEIKSSSTIVPKHGSSLKRSLTDLSDVVNQAAIISTSPESFLLTQQITNYRWQDILLS